MKLFQYILWILVIYFVIRVVKSLLTLRKRSQHRQEKAPYLNIEEADFEDITEKREGKDNDETSKSS